MPPDATPHSAPLMWMARCYPPRSGTVNPNQIVLLMSRDTFGHSVSYVFVQLKPGSILDVPGSTGDLRTWKQLGRDRFPNPPVKLFVPSLYVPKGFYRPAAGGTE